MSARIYDSGPLVARVTSELQAEAEAFRLRWQRSARLAQVIVGHDEAAEVYHRQLLRASRSIGLECVTVALPFSTTESEVRAAVADLHDDSSIDGVVILLPLPAHIRQRVVTDVLEPRKDVDGLGPRNAGNLLLGFPNFIPSTADAVRLLLHDAAITVAGRNAVVVGRSNIGGKPIALTLMQLDATVTLCHSYTEDLASITKEADILVVSVGHPGLITAAMVKPGAVVLDAGIHVLDGKVVGDVDRASVQAVASFLTPVPGGLGPLTHLTLLRHTLLGPIPPPTVGR